MLDQTKAGKYYPVLVSLGKSILYMGAEKYEILRSSVLEIRFWNVDISHYDISKHFFDSEDVCTIDQVSFISFDIL